MLWPANVMIYGTCGLPELLIKEQHGDQSLIRATVKGQRKAIKRLRDPAILTGNQRDVCTVQEIICSVRGKKALAFYPFPAYLAFRGFGAPVCDKMDLALTH